jgi:hypothetical protein
MPMLPSFPACTHLTFKGRPVDNPDAVVKLLQILTGLDTSDGADADVVLPSLQAFTLVYLPFGRYDEFHKDGAFELTDIIRCFSERRRTGTPLRILTIERCVNIELADIEELREALHPTEVIWIPAEVISEYEGDVVVRKRDEDKEDSDDQSEDEEESD